MLLRHEEAPVDTTLVDRNDLIAEFTPVNTFGLLCDSIEAKAFKKGGHNEHKARDYV